MVHISKTGVVLKNGFFFYAELQTRQLGVLKVHDNQAWFIGDSDSCDVRELVCFEEVEAILIIKEVVFTPN